MAGRAGSRGNNRIVKVIVLVVIIAALGYMGYWFYNANSGSRKAEQTIKTLQDVIPGLGSETAVQTGLGRDPLAAISIDGVDIVGVIEIPSLDIMAPVAGKDVDEEYFASWLDGSPVKGNFKVLGGHDDLFRRISKLKPGDKVVFTDIDGVRYNYTVTTQYHLKKWDEGDNDLQLCYASDGDTYFVVGCTIQ